MNLISLNLWAGHLRQPILEFVKRQAHVDVFCLQEVYRKGIVPLNTCGLSVSLDIFSEIADALPEHTGFFRPTVNGVYGLAAFVKRSLKVQDEGEVLIHENPEYPGKGPLHSRNLQWLRLETSEGEGFTVVNVHGLWNGQGKTDTAPRIEQSQRIRRSIDGLDTPFILCGDFNLRPDTESLRIVASGLDNLIDRYGVTSTRTSLYTKEERYADYAFVSPGISVGHFQVLPDEVSDHSAIKLDFSLIPATAVRALV